MNDTVLVFESMVRYLCIQIDHRIPVVSLASQGLLFSAPFSFDNRPTSDVFLLFSSTHREPAPRVLLSGIVV